MNTYGYIRVSSRDQNEDRQWIALRETGLTESSIYLDKQSGKDFDRPGYQKLLRKLKKDDLLYIKSIDRLGRNYEEILEQWRVITREKQADIVILDFPLLDTRSKSGDLTGRFIADMVLQILAYVAQTERENIRQRQSEGIAAAKARGQHLGRKKIELPDNFDELYHAFEQGELTLEELCEKSNLKRSTFFARLQEYRTAKKEQMKV